MKLDRFRIKNFRRLRDTLVDLDEEMSIFVGANNSGKTSATQAVLLFLNGEKRKFSLHDFSAHCRESFKQLDEWDAETGDERPSCPSISVDFWFGVDSEDLHRVISLLPNLDWAGSRVGVRIEFAAKNPEALLRNYRENKEELSNRASDEAGDSPPIQDSYEPWPTSLWDYLDEKLADEFELKYFVLDEAQFDSSFQEPEGYTPDLLTSGSQAGKGKAIIDSLIRVSSLGAQRHLAEDSSGSRSEDLSNSLSRFYKRNLDQLGADFEATKTLSISKDKLDDHLGQVFDAVLKRLGRLGYPGIGNPKLLIQSALNPSTVLGGQDGARVFYSMGEEGEEFSLPDQYNGLGFKNLIYMVVELLDFDSQWRNTEDNRVPLHLIFIEEPEAHMHAQIQQVFIRQIIDLLKPEGSEESGFHTQFAITTHSSHILYERDFTAIRYFRREGAGAQQQTHVVNLSAIYDIDDSEDQRFLERYLKITHCDLFFADAAILVEGNVERLLMPLMIRDAAPRLNQTYLSVLEVGGAHAHKFQRLLEELQITTLIVTDLDSVEGPRGKACLAQKDGARTSNQTLKTWIPEKTSITDLLAVSDDEKEGFLAGGSEPKLRIAYQTETEVTWQGDSAVCVGRTLEEAFALENLPWTQSEEQESLGLIIPEADSSSLTEMQQKLYERVNKKSFKKTSFALELMLAEVEEWKVPSYIAEGLGWLESRVVTEDLGDSDTTEEVTADECF